MTLIFPGSSAADPSKRYSSKNSQRGAALIESMVAILVSAIGVLGLLGLQTRTLANTHAAFHRAQAVRLVEELTERIRIMPAESRVINSHATGGSSGIPAINCRVSACDESQLLSYSFSEWRKAVRTSLPEGQAQLFVPPSESNTVNRRQLGVLISWGAKEPDKSTEYIEPLDGSKRHDGTKLTTVSGTAASCPSNMTCHIQYIEVAPRCSVVKQAGANRIICPGRDV